MGNKMQDNYNSMIKHPAGSLKESVDILRSNIKDLYELDEDNYQMCKNLQKALDQANKRIDRSNKHVRRLGRLAGFGFILLGVGHVILNRIVGDQAEKIDKLEQKITVLTDVDKKAEESDG